MDKNSDQGQRLLQTQSSCQALIASNPGHVTYRECEGILTQFLQASNKKNGGDQACYNMYDVRLKDSYPSCGMNWPPDLEYVTPYLRKSGVVKALHVNPERNIGWKECNGAVSSSFDTKNAKPAIDLMPDLLSDVPILLFSGAEDLICNYVGTEDMISNMEWNGGKGFEETPGNWAPRRDWTFEGEAAGFWQAARNLTYVHFYNASHMVPFDYPRRSRDMLDRFMGVDITSIGGQATDSRLDGEKGPGTTIGDVTNPKESEEAVKQQLKEAQWAAYRRSGGVALVFVIIAAAGFGFFVWRQRRKGAAYSALRSDDNAVASREVFRDRQNGDLETGQEEGIALQSTPLPTDKYSVGDDSDEEGEGHQNGKKAEKRGNA
jgi:carboxypeptidase D